MTGLFDQVAARWSAIWSGAEPLTAIEAGVALGVGLLGLSTALLVSIWRQGRGTAPLEGKLETVLHGQNRSDSVLREELARNREELERQTKHLREEVGGSIRGVGENVEKRLDDVKGTVDLRLRSLQEENEKKLDQMRSTVDEKLQGTLEKRLGEAFLQVSQRLEAVHKGLGEMQNLAVGVGDLKKVLSNVKTRGTFGETQLQWLLEQTLAPGQWEREVTVRPRSSERVDFAVRMPGADGDNGEPCWLPLDSKFPQEDYLRLVEAQENGDAAAADEAGKALELRIKTEARRMRDKYISPPHTTDFAVLFVPTEGLYAEVLRRPSLAEWLQVECKIMVAGPTNVLALLNSLGMGFRTLAIQKRSSEVWKILGAVKSEFGKFGDILESVDKKLQEASNTISKASTKSRGIERRLGKVEQLPEGEAAALLTPASEE
jgi:DNA recombination protein RmuC